MQKIISWTVVILFIAWALFAFVDKQKQDMAPLADSSSSDTINSALSSDNDATINTAVTKASVSYTADGFSPSTITVKKGTEVVFSNESGKNFWPASALHPTHTVYPGSSITKCGTADAISIFDACVGIPSGDTWSFMFNKTGSWGYHNHLNASNFGTVIVTE